MFVPVCELFRILEDAGNFGLIIIQSKYLFSVKNLGLDLLQNFSDGGKPVVFMSRLNAAERSVCHCAMMSG